MLLECKDTTFQYPNTDTYVFKDLTCRVSGPGFHALFGPSGVGKTTLARIRLEQKLIPGPVSVERILRPYSEIVNR